VPGAVEPSTPPVDKRAYHLFNPVPADQLRPLYTDRPDRTETPYTVDPGHIQVEMDVVNYLHDRNDRRGVDLELDVWNVAPVNFKVGLLHDLDVQVVLDNYLHVRAEDHRTGQTASEGAFGDVTTRLKYNLWGNDSSGTALALMPFVTAPTSTFDGADRSVTGGLIVPFYTELPAGFGLGLMTEFDAVRNQFSNGYETAFVNTITISHALVGELEAFLEFASEVRTGDTRWMGTVDTGLLYQVTPNLQLDAGVYIGVTPSAPDVQTFLGVTFRY